MRNDEVIGGNKYYSKDISMNISNFYFRWILANIRRIVFGRTIASGQSLIFIENHSSISSKNDFRWRLNKNCLNTFIVAWTNSKWQVLAVSCIHAFSSALPLVNISCCIWQFLFVAVFLDLGKQFGGSSIQPAIVSSPSPKACNTISFSQMSFLCSIS